MRLIYFAAAYLATFPATAAPVFSWTFDQPTGYVLPTDIIPMAITVTNTGLTSNPFYISNIHAGELAPAGYSISHDVPSFMANIQGLTLLPGQSVQVNFGFQTPSPGPAAPGTYTLTQAHLIFCSDNQNQDCSIRIAPANSFERTVVAENAVPEPGYAPLAAILLLGLAGVRTRPVHTPKK